MSLYDLVNALFAPAWLGHLLSFPPHQSISTRMMKREMAIVGRSLLGWAMPLRADRRLVACAGYAAQLAGSVVFIGAAGSNVPLLLLGVVLFGAGFGNATSLPPLIAQMEFVKADVPRVVALIVGIAQGSYAIAPAAFGLVREIAPHAVGGAAPGVFAAAAVVQGLAICALLAGRDQ